MNRAPLILLFTLGCGRAGVGGLQAPTVADGGVADVPVLCRGLDESACQATNAACKPAYCSNCNGGGDYVDCIPEGEEINCPAACEAPCDALPEAVCSGEPRCLWQECFGCGGEQLFERCLDRFGAIDCPAVVCPPPEEKCESADETECIAASDCHPVYQHAGELCDCDAPGCCMIFSECAPGGQALCENAMLGCRRQAPFCDGEFVISYTETCYEGCVRIDDCPP